MTLEEAIIHCNEKACGNTQCALEHRQLAEWLQELQALRKNNKGIEERAKDGVEFFLNQSQEITEENIEKFAER